jgi:hypothetical protein
VEYVNTIFNTMKEEYNSKPYKTKRLERKK